MSNFEIPSGTVHKTPTDLHTALTANGKSLAIWGVISPLARNEWICWVESAKLTETRKRRVQRTITELSEGKRRPCCWIGCIHRTDKPISPSVQGILNRKTKSKK